jgi:hypothetical protein
MKTSRIVVSLLIAAGSFAGGYVYHGVGARSRAVEEPATYYFDEAEDYVVTNVVNDGPLERVAMQNTCGTIHFKLGFGKVLSLKDGSSEDAPDTKLKKGDVLSIRDSYFRTSNPNSPWFAAMSSSDRGIAMPATPSFHAGAWQ